MEIGKMRRRTRELKKISEIEHILEIEKICHLGMSVDDQPYVIPMIYVYNENAFYFHCAEVGTKLDMIKDNDKVCIEVESNGVDDLVENQGSPCMWGLPYKSVIAFGRAEISDDEKEKIKMFDLLIKKLKPKGYNQEKNIYMEKRLKGARLIKVTVDSMTGKCWDGVK